MLPLCIRGNLGQKRESGSLENALYPKCEDERVYEIDEFSSIDGHPP